MSQMIKVYLNSKKDDARRIVDAELIEDRTNTILIKLDDGSIIVRKKNRDIVKE